MNWLIESESNNEWMWEDDFEVDEQGEVIRNDDFLTEEEYDDCFEKKQKKKGTINSRLGGHRGFLGWILQHTLHFLLTILFRSEAQAVSQPVPSFNSFRWHSKGWRGRRSRQGSCQGHPGRRQGQEVSYRRL